MIQPHSSVKVSAGEPRHHRLWRLTFSSDETTEAVTKNEKEMDRDGLLGR